MAKGQKKQAQIKIDKKQFEKLCAIQCTREEICDFFDVSQATLIRWCKNEYDKDFETIFRIKKQFGKVSLRRRQWILSEKSTPMAIWLGKQWLGQKDDNDSRNMIVQPIIIDDIGKNKNNIGKNEDK